MTFRHAWLFFILLLIGVLCPMALAVPSETLGEEQWVKSPEGSTLLRSFRNASFPHASREKGRTYDGKFYDAASHYSDSTVGIFIPSGYRPGKSVNYVVHFHGWSNHVAGVLDHYELRRQFADSGRDAILLVPQGPKDAPDSCGGRLEAEPGVFEALLTEVTEFLAQSGKIETTKIGTIVLSTHSGGCRVAGAVLSQAGLRDHITDVLLFDSSYEQLESFAGWAASGHHRRLDSIFTRHLAPENFTLLTMLQKRHIPVTAILEPEKNEALLALRQSLLVHTLDLPHDEVMQKRDYFALFLRTSALPGKQTADK